MTIVTLPEAKAHLRLEPDYPDDQVQDKLAAAEQRAAHFINRALFGTDADRQAAMAAAPAAITAAGAAYTDALAAASAVTDPVAASMLHAQAQTDYAAAQARARETLAGIVATSDIKAAILLILGNLYENRADVQDDRMAALPNGAQYLLMPHRVGWGI
ncbi:phage gp6-like head-tail connector protein [Ottowia sp. GY511]|uniref:Head-tail connector protein n=1 Tax=Ottowia flava TaxID=2675430 RepID=A0ABW4KM32_9BURK|nr:head-tail connector protein [Ottowia sp. GY511]TXK26373.1 phage gp6-like head-tail connector protein [Ottowia sp. GY511]